MRAGYPWTGQIKLMLQLATTSIAQSPLVFQPNHQDSLDILGGLDMDAWILGRQSAPNHVWARHCSGQPGIERITGLPRSLLDLIAQASLLLDVNEDLQSWELEKDLDLGKDRYTVIDSWHCYRLAARLFLHQHVGALTDFEQILEQLSEKVFSIAAQGSDSQYFNQRILLWPLCLIISLEKREVQLDRAVDVILRVLRSTGSGSQFGDPLLRLINEFVKRQASGVAGDLQSIACDLYLEVGIW